jgi:hypothetical protein
MNKIIDFLVSIFDSKYSALEDYINSRNPQTAADVEVLTREFNNKMTFNRMV